MDDPDTMNKVDRFSIEERRKTAQYIGEGITFLLGYIRRGRLSLSSVMRQIKLQQQQQNFMMAITHELKTPISVAKLNLETLQKYNLDESRQKKLFSLPCRK